MRALIEAGADVNKASDVGASVTPLFRSPLKTAAMWWCSC